MAAAAERSRLRRVLVGLASFLVVAVGLVISLGTLQIDEAAEDVGRVEDPFPAEEQRPEDAAGDALTFLVVGVDPADQATGGPGRRPRCCCG